MDDENDKDRSVVNEFQTVQEDHAEPSGCVAERCKVHDMEQKKYSLWT